MTEIADWTALARQHVDELYRVGAIGTEKRKRLQDNIRTLGEELETHYREVAADRQASNTDGALFEAATSEGDDDGG